VALVEELVRGGEQLVVRAHGQPDSDVVAEIQARGGAVLMANRVREADLRTAG
jgi:hypothetical protein